MSTSRVEPWLKTTHVKITSDTCNVVKVRAAVMEAARSVGFAETDVSAIALAIDEAVCNVIKHGYRGRSGQPIEVMLEPLRRQGRIGLQVTICDRAPQVDPAGIAGRDLEDVRPGGLGTHIIRTVMDEVEYSHRQPEGMQLRVVKMLDNSRGSAGQVKRPVQENPADD